LALGQLNISVYSVLINDLEMLQQHGESAHKEIKKLEFLKEYALQCNEQLEVMVTYMGTTYNMCCRLHMKITHISAGSWFMVIC
jgi:hypothetical protein